MNWAAECRFAYDGAAASVVLFALPVAVLLTLITLLLYRRAIGRAMRAAAPDSAPLSQAPPSSSPPTPLELLVQAPAAADHTDPLLRRALDGARRLSVAYAVAGVVHALVAVLIYFRLSDLPVLPLRTLLVVVVFAWPAVVVWAISAVASRRQQWIWIGGYFALLLGLEIIAEVTHLRHQPAFGELFVLWAITMGPQTVVLALLSNRAWRPVGLIALFVAIVLVGAYMFGFQLLGCLVLTTRSPLLLSLMPYAQGLIVLACALGAWQLLRRVGRRHNAKRTSDQMFTVDSWWLLVTAIQVLTFLGPTQGASIAMAFAFIAYRLVLRLWLTRTSKPANTDPPRSILLLRVFGHTARVRALTDQVGQAWRQVGPINMIGGTDLATALIEPDELIAFWSGRLRQGFVAGAADLRARIAALDEKPDPDGRYRINEFFCHDNTWRGTVQALAQRSAVVLMDLRGFGKLNRGCEFELSLLLSEIPLDRVVLLVDGSTRMDELRPLLFKAWGQLPMDSPNRALMQPRLRLLNVPKGSDVLPALLASVFAAAS